MDPTRSKHRYLTIAERVLLIGGVVCLALFGAGAAHRALGQQQALSGFARLAAATPDMSSWSPQRIAAYRDSLRQAKEATAVLRISSVDVQTPVFDGVNELNLNRGVARIRGTADFGAAGNLGIAGHRDGFFRNLKDIEHGDRLELQMPDGALVYRVENIAIVDPEDVWVLESADEPMITLVTCYPFYFVGSAPQRFVVQARLTGGGSPR